MHQEVKFLKYLNFGENAGNCDELIYYSLLLVFRCPFANREAAKNGK